MGLSAIANFYVKETIMSGTHHDGNNRSYDNTTYLVVPRLSYEWKNKRGRVRVQESKEKEPT